jgi:peptidoglycan/LPS O-acetylase OafA/YrhL
VGVCALLVGLGYLAQHYAGPGLHKASTDAEAWVPLAANTVLVPLVFAVGLWATEGGRWAKAKGPSGVLNKMITLLAQSSYAFYLAHIGPAAKLVYLLARHNNLLAFVALWILSIVIHKTIEYPILRIVHAKGRIR